MVIGNASASLFVTVPNISVGGSIEGFCQEILATAVLAIIVLALGDEVRLFLLATPRVDSLSARRKLTFSFSEQRPARSWTRSARTRICRDRDRNEHGMDFRCVAGSFRLGSCSQVAGSTARKETGADLLPSLLSFFRQHAPPTHLKSLTIITTLLHRLTAPPCSLTAVRPSTLPSPTSSHRRSGPSTHSLLAHSGL
jgi:hypothetical protein